MYMRRTRSRRLRWGDDWPCPAVRRGWLAQVLIYIYIYIYIYIEIRCIPLGPCRRRMPRVLWWS